MTPTEALQKLKKRIKPQWKIAFAAAMLLGLAIHMPILLSDIPNHDGLDSMYFDQNMITSGRWFLTIACGISSYFTIPWVIGLLGLIFLACGAAALTELLKLEDTVAIVAASGLLVAFPALASTFAYVYTLDGYMLAILLAILAVLWVEKGRLGFLPGALCLACSMGIYQSYLPFAILLCIYKILIICMEDGIIKQKIKSSLNYLYMGMAGAALYLIILQVLLKIQGKELASYQGIDQGLGQLGAASAETGLLSTIVSMYRDFFAFTLRGNVLFNSPISAAAFLGLVAFVLFTLVVLAVKRKWWKKFTFFVIIGLLVLVLPIVSNVILLISPDVTYHLLMRYQWVLYLICMLAFISRYAGGGRWMTAVQWGAMAAALVLLLHYGVTDNIAYSNLEKRYEKTYAYCLRLLDRIEQTQGYYQGIPIAMIGVVSDVEYPPTDITGKVTSNMIGMNGDSLLYRGTNYQIFMKNYLGATLNILPQEAMEEMYYHPEYMEMDSFPGRDSIRIIDGIMYIKTENADR